MEIECVPDWCDCICVNMQPPFTLKCTFKCFANEWWTIATTIILKKPRLTRTQPTHTINICIYTSTHTSSLTHNTPIRPFAASTYLVSVFSLPFSMEIQRIRHSTAHLFNVNAQYCSWNAYMEATVCRLCQWDVGTLFLARSHTYTGLTLVNRYMRLHRQQHMAHNMVNASHRTSTPIFSRAYQPFSINSYSPFFSWWT